MDLFEYGQLFHDTLFDLLFTYVSCAYRNHHDTNNGHCIKEAWYTTNTMSVIRITSRKNYRCSCLEIMPMRLSNTNEYCNVL